MPRNIKVFNIHTELDKDDKCTIVSIVPFLISEFKPGIYPGRFVILPCLDARKPEILSVGQSVYFISQSNGDEEMPPFVVKTPSRDIATAVVKDYLSAQMDVKEGCQPGICWIGGGLTSEEFKVKHASLYTQLKKDQLNWFGKLVERADNDWNRYKNHKVISDNQRFAARALGMERDWLVTESINVPVKCPACLANCSPEAVVCSNCRCILKPEEYKKLTFAA